MDRRHFLSLGSGALLTAAISSRMGFQGPEKLKDIGLQVYTLRDMLAKDPEGTLRSVANLGYSHIELFGYRNGKYFGKSISEIKGLTDDLGLRVTSAHYLSGQQSTDMGTPVNQWEKAVADAAALGQQYMAIAYLMPEERKTLDDYRRVADILNRAGEITAQYGLTMAYHNHDFEFTPLEGQLPADILLKKTDRNLVKFELDIYWIVKAGQDPLAFFRANPGRVPLWHIKDMEKGTGDFAPVGDGTIPWATLFREQGTASMTHFFVEQDTHRIGTPLENIGKSFRWLRELDY